MCETDYGFGYEQNDECYFVYEETSYALKDYSRIIVTDAVDFYASEGHSDQVKSVGSPDGIGEEYSLHLGLCQSPLNKNLYYFGTIDVALEECWYVKNDFDRNPTKSESFFYIVY